MTTPLVTIHPEIVSGAAVFAGTRMPIQVLFDYLEDNCTIDEFVLEYPWLSREEVTDVLARAGKLLEQDATKIASV